MSNRLTLLAYSRSEDGDEVARLFSEWVDSDLLDQVGLVNIDQPIEATSTEVDWIEDGSRSTTSLSDVLTGRMWKFVTLVSMRLQSLETYSSNRFDSEFDLIATVRRAFLATEVRCYSLGVAQSAPAFKLELFDPQFDAHFLHDPVLVADNRVATLPITDGNRSVVCLMSAVTISGGLRWQSAPTIDISEAASGMSRPVRLFRVQVRAINAGRFVDDVLAGAFPESGPWTTPPEVKAVQAPPGSTVDSGVISDVCSLAAFTCEPFVGPPRRLPESISLVDGLVLFMKNFVDALKRAPFIMIDQFVTSVGDRVTRAAQRLTFGSDSALVMEFKPGMPRADTERLLEQLQSARMPDIAPPAIPDPRPWQILRETALSLVDGGDIPVEVHAPTHNTHRVLYVDPWAIGPAPSDTPFELTEGERELVGLQSDIGTIGPMDVADARALDAVLSNLTQRHVPQPRPLPPPSSAVDSSQEGAGEQIVEIEDDVPAAVVPVANFKPGTDGFDASTFEPVSAFYQGSKPDEAARYEDHKHAHQIALEGSEPVDGAWKRNKGCDFCGVAFHHGIAYRHTVTGHLVHVGHVCAKKNGLAPPPNDPTAGVLGDLQDRWQDWVSLRRNSFLWQVGEQIVQGIEQAAAGLADALSKVSQQTHVDMSEDELARQALRRWGKLLILIIVVAVIATFAVWLLALLPVIYILGGGIASVIGVITKIALLSRELARLQTRLTQGLSERQRAELAAQHYARQLSHLENSLTQFEDWQAIIRSVTHTPFGTPPAPSEALPSSVSVNRPHSFVYGSSRPSPDQLTQAQLNARRMTVHRGWMGTVFEEMKHQWRQQYQRVLLDTPPDPEADNSGHDIVRVRLPGSASSVFGPRQDFKERCEVGELQAAVIGVHTTAILQWLREVPLDELLSRISVTGSGAALNGMAATEFLEGVNFGADDAPSFAADTLGNSPTAIQLRTKNVAETLPPLTDASALESADAAAKGRDLLFAAHRVTISPPIAPELLAGISFSESQLPQSEGGAQPESPV